MESVMQARISRVHGFASEFGWGFANRTTFAPVP